MSRKQQTQKRAKRTPGEAQTLRPVFSRVLIAQSPARLCAWVFGTDDGKTSPCQEPARWSMRVTDHLRRDLCDQHARKYRAHRAHDLTEIR